MNPKSQNPEPASITGLTPAAAPPADSPSPPAPAVDARAEAYARDQAAQAATHTRSQGDRFRRKQDAAKRAN